MWKIKIVLASENPQLVCLFICLLVDDPCSKIPISVLSHFLSLQFIVTWSSTNFYDCQKTLSEEEKRGKNKKQTFGEKKLEICIVAVDLSELHCKEKSERDDQYLLISHLPCHIQDNQQHSYILCTYT